MLKDLITYFRFQFAYYQLSHYKDEDGYWSLTSETIDRIGNCYRVIPSEHFDRLTLSTLQSIKFPFNTESVHVWVEVVNDAISVVEQGETFPSNTFMRYQNPVSISLNRYLSPTNIEGLLSSIKEIHGLLTHLITAMSKHEKMFNYYVRHCNRLIEDGVNVLVCLLTLYKRNQFYVKQKQTA